MKRPALGHVFGYTALTVILTAGAAQSLAGSSTVYSDDIVDSTITTADMKNGAVNGSKILDGDVRSIDVHDDTLTGADINESTFALTCPTGMTRVGALCAGALSGPSKTKHGRNRLR